MTWLSVSIYRKFISVNKLLGFIPQSELKDCSEYLYQILNVLVATFFCTLQVEASLDVLRNKEKLIINIILLTYYLNELIFVITCCLIRLIYRKKWIRLLMNMEYFMNVKQHSKINNVKATLQTLAGGLLMILRTVIRVQELCFLESTSINSFVFIRCILGRFLYFCSFLTICLILDINAAVHKNLIKAIENVVKGVPFKNESDILLTVFNIRRVLKCVTVTFKYINKIFAWTFLCLYMETILIILSSVATAINETGNYFYIIRMLFTVVSLLLIIIFHNSIEMQATNRHFLGVTQLNFCPGSSELYLVTHTIYMPFFFYTLKYFIYVTEGNKIYQNHPQFLQLYRIVEYGPQHPYHPPQ